MKRPISRLLGLAAVSAFLMLLSGRQREQELIAHIGDTCVVLLRTGLILVLALAYKEADRSRFLKRGVPLLLAASGAWLAGAPASLALLLFPTAYALAAPPAIFLMSLGHAASHLFSLTPFYELPLGTFSDAAAVAAAGGFLWGGRAALRPVLGWLALILLYLAANIGWQPRYGPVEWNLISTDAITRQAALGRLETLSTERKHEVSEALAENLAARRLEYYHSDGTYTKAFIKMGPAAFPALFKTFVDPQNPEMEYTVREALAAQGQATAPGLVELLAWQNPQVRRLATEALLAMKEEERRPALAGEQKAAADILAEAVRTGDAAARQDAYKTLALLGPAAKQALPALLERLKMRSKDSHPLYAALEAMGPAAAPAVPELIAILEEGAASPHSVTLALKSLGAPLERDVVPILLVRLRKAGPHQRAPWCAALGELGPAARQAAHDLSALAGKENDPGGSCAAALAKIGQR